MMLLRTRHGNGYSCGCCYSSWEASDWTEEVGPEGFLDDVVERIEEGRYGEDVCRSSELERLTYEQDGEVVYCCEVQGDDWWLERPDGKRFELFGWIAGRPNKITHPVDREAALTWLREDTK